MDRTIHSKSHSLHALPAAVIDLEGNTVVNNHENNCTGVDHAVITLGIPRIRANCTGVCISSYRFDHILLFPRATKNESAIQRVPYSAYNPRNLHHRLGHSGFPSV